MLDEIATNNSEEDDRYLADITRIVCAPPRVMSSKRPCRLLPHLYIGNMDNARNEQLLKLLGITHVLNCAADTLTPSGCFPCVHVRCIVCFVVLTFLFV